MSFFFTRWSNVTYPRFKLFSDVVNNRLFLYLPPENKNTFKNDLHVDSGNLKIFEISLTLCPFFSSDSSFKLLHIFFSIKFVRQIHFCRRWEWHHAIYDRQLNEWSQNEQKPSYDCGSFNEVWCVNNSRRLLFFPRIFFTIHCTLTRK